MASNSKKVISINPDFFKIGGKSSKKNKKNKKAKRRDNDALSSSVNKGLKKNLLNKLKQHQRNRDNEKMKTEIMGDNINNNVDDELEKSIDFLNSIVKKRKSKKEKKRNNKTIKKKPLIENTPQVQAATIDANFEKSESLVINNKTPDINNPKQPKFGCLKNGKLPTYKQYNKTMKNRNQDNTDDKRPPIAFNDTPVYNETFDERQKNLKDIKVTYNMPPLSPKATILEEVSKPAPIVTIDNTLNITNKKRKKRKHKLKTIKRKITLGKKHGIVGVLIKNRKTRKNVKKEVSNLEKKSMTNIKRYLRKHNLVKIGTSAPDDILRNIYESSYLSGDIYNKNPDTLLHNFMKA